MRPARRQRFAFGTVGLLLLTAGLVHAEGDRWAPAQDVVAFVDAFNARRIDAMLSAVTEDVELVSLGEGTASVDAMGRDALRQFLQDYFAANPDVRSRIDWSSASPQRVAAMETVRWTDARGSHVQSSVSVYEFRDRHIRRVWYFPAESPPPQD